mmetsp:Transcript_9092/g.23109  ORF Transcript_9092/g.23109 Transcript_9092/m.23109 type:complete len:204 (+) Transcript_9092:181-792(+)
MRQLRCAWHSSLLILNNPHLGRAEAPVVQLVSHAHHVADHPRLLSGVRHLEERLVQIRVEFLTKRIYSHQSDGREALYKLLVCQLDAFVQCPKRRVLRTGAHRLWHQLKGTLEVVGHLEECLGEPPDGVLVRVVDLDGSALADVVGVRHGAEQLVVPLLELLLSLCELGLERRHILPLRRIPGSRGLLHGGLTLLDRRRGEAS